ncbi:hypothetical protein ACQ4WX_37135 [Streptomyces lasalocidi]
MQEMYAAETGAPSGVPLDNEELCDRMFSLLTEYAADDATWALRPLVPGRHTGTACDPAGKPVVPECGCLYGGIRCTQWLLAAVVGRVRNGRCDRWLSL